MIYVACWWASFWLRSLAEFPQQLTESNWLNYSLWRIWLPPPQTWHTSLMFMPCCVSVTLCQQLDGAFVSGSGHIFYIPNAVTMFDSCKKINKMAKWGMTVFTCRYKCTRNVCHFCFWVFLSCEFFYVKVSYCFRLCLCSFSSSEQMLPFRDSEYTWKYVGVFFFIPGLLSCFVLFS